MPLIAARCTQCNAELKVDPTHKTAMCPHCRTPFITEQAVNNYVHNTNINIGEGGVVVVADDSRLEGRIRSGETFITLEKYNDAHEIFQELIKEAPYDYRVWIGMIKVCSRNFTDFDLSRDQLNVIVDFYLSAKKVVDQDKVAIVEQTCDEYIMTVADKLTALENRMKECMSSLQQEHAAAVYQTQQRIKQLQEQKSRVDFLTTPLTLILTLVCVLAAALFSEEADQFVLLLFLFGALDAVALVLFNVIWSSHCENKRRQIQWQIDCERMNLDELQRCFGQQMAQYQMLMQKAVGSYQT